MLCAVAGLTSDANILVNYARVGAQRYLLTYGSQQPVEQLVQNVCNYKQAYTQFGGQRPFGVSFLYAGYDKYYGFQLYHSDPSGNYGGWIATAIGANNRAAKNMLKNEIKEEGALSTIDEALMLAVKVMSKSMDTSIPSSEKIEFTTLTLDKDTKEVKTRYLNDGEVKVLLERFEKEKESAEDK